MCLVYLGRMCRLAHIWNAICCFKLFRHLLMLHFADCWVVLQSYLLIVHLFSFAHQYLLQFLLIGKVVFFFFRKHLSYDDWWIVNFLFLNQSMQKGGKVVNCPSVDRHLTEAEGGSEGGLQEEEVLAPRFASKKDQSNQKAAYQAPGNASLCI